MFLEYQHFELLGKSVMERVVFQPPLKAGQVMENEACLIYAFNGTSKLYSGTQTEDLAKEESVLMKCGSFLNSWHTNPDGSPNVAIAFHFYSEVLRLVYNNEIPNFLKNNSEFGGKLIQKIDSDAAITNFFNGLIYYFENPELATEDLVILKVRELILLLYNTNSHGIREILSDLFNPTQTEFKEIIKANIFNDHSLEDFALLTNLSLSSFKRAFKKTFGESPARYIKLKRLEEAADQLKVTKKRISDICFDCGFNDLGHFSKSFAAQYDLSPSEYRKQFLG